MVLRFPGDPVSFYPKNNVAWLRNEYARAKKAITKAEQEIYRLRQARRARALTRNRFQDRVNAECRKLAREKENMRRALADLEQRFASPFISEE